LAERFEYEKLLDLLVPGATSLSSGALTCDDELRAEGKTARANGKVKAVTEKAIDEVKLA